MATATVKRTSVEASSSAPFLSTADFLRLKSFSIAESIAWSKYRKILVTGMGGGCDVCSAFVFARYIQKHSLIDSESGSEIFFGNCIGPRASLSSHHKLSEAIYEIRKDPSKTPIDLSTVDKSQFYGTTILEESLVGAQPATLRGPILSVVHHKRMVRDNPELDTVSKVTSVNTSALVRGWVKEGFDLIIAIDNGGDSITGGIDFHDSYQLARDVQVSLALGTWVSLRSDHPSAHSAIDDSRDLSATATPKVRHAFHIVFGPCCDGESTEQLMIQTILGVPLSIKDKTMSSSEDRGDDDGESTKSDTLPSFKVDWMARFEGSFALSKEMIYESEQLCRVMGSSRTPSIMKRAFDLYSPDLSIVQQMKVDRGIEPYIGLDLLTSALVFSYPIGK